MHLILLILFLALVSNSAIEPKVLTPGKKIDSKGRFLSHAGQVQSQWSKQCRESPGPVSDMSPSVLIMLFPLFTAMLKLQKRILLTIKEQVLKLFIAK
jgi:hypothetical protein